MQSNTEENARSAGRISLDVCHPSGTIRRQVLREETLAHVPTLYEALKRTTWGGLFPAFGLNIHTRTDASMVVDEQVSPLAKKYLNWGEPTQVSRQTHTKVAATTARSATKKQAAVKAVPTNLGGGKHAYLTSKGMGKATPSAEGGAEPFQPAPADEAETVPPSTASSRQNRSTQQGKRPLGITGYLKFLEKTGEAADTDGKGLKRRISSRPRKQQEGERIETVRSDSKDTIRVR
jgi:hypothetical protein